MPATRAELAASYALTERIIEAVPGGVVHVKADGNIVRANAEALRILGLTFDSITNKYTVDFETETIWQDGSPCLAQDYPVSKALSTGLPQRATTIGVRRPDGRVSWAVFTALPIKDPATQVVTSAVVTFLDITQHKRAEMRLRESEATLRAVLHSAPSVIVKADVDGTIRYSNRTVVAGRTAEECIGTNLFAIVPESKRAMVRTCVAKVIETQMPDGYELEREANDGRIVADSVIIGPVMQNEVVTGITMIVTDITELRQLKTRLVVADRLASVGTLAAGVAHEINNPLTYLLFKLGKLKKAAVGELVDDAALAIEGADRIRRIVEDLGTFSRASTDSIGPVNVKDALELAINMSATQMRFRAQLVREYSDIPPVLGNASRLGQVFVNLLINAIQAIDEGDVANNEIRITTTTTDDGRVRVDVRDTGHGISESLLSRVFEPFVTTKKLGEGTGLGLHICHSIVSSMRGELTVQSQVGTGTVFSVTMPSTERALEPALPTPAPTPAAAHLRILVVDDEPAICQVFDILLEGHDVTTVNTGREALEAFRNAEFDLVFCDLVMPDVTGMEVYQQLQTQQPQALAAFVFMTGGVFSERAATFLDAVTNPVLAKPFDVNEILDLVAARAQLR